ncbi:4'-phosphopantetheinyl transferase family protein [Acinetobacter larvae]|uniref:Enterobactin synthase component D n=1 Tax=Acinetobacter larvae TaxID=1789224 RepID=A0A1B2LWJ4_9GAMM|nr:4'-phosphopantetheinyl transferase superfamily protein [Acinetobacter larvae]AOA57305.1 hypothetical protein BFG52_02320 [Acinetobacter larvae]
MTKQPIYFEPAQYKQINDQGIILHYVALQHNENIALHKLYQNLNINMPNNIQKSATKRQCEFLIGRIAAKYSLSHLNYRQDFTIYKGKGGEPLWPEHIIGSISHAMYNSTSGVAIAYTTRDKRKIVGLDIEIKNHNGVFLSNKLTLNQFLNKLEIKYVKDFITQESHIYLLLFSAKESLIKAIYQRYLFFVRFRDIQCLHINLQYNFILFDIACLERQEKFMVNFIHLEQEIITYCIDDDTVAETAAAQLI